MALNSARTTEAVASYHGLVNGLRQAQIRAFVPLYVVGDNKAVINQLRVRRSPVRPRLSTLYREARDFADALSVVSWGHHSCEYNLMAAGAATTTIANVATLWRRCNGAPEQHTGQPVWSYYHRQQREWCLATSVNSAHPVTSADHWHSVYRVRDCGDTHSKLRNHLNPNRVDELTFIKSNLPTFYGLHARW
uniref:RNase H type-1 domain-containing protein n=1 Tax=Hyaloperonospora arabidopsidis (strain Emoy2) TaxID=559515 RepID=M4BLE4_HYAAE